MSRLKLAVIGGGHLGRIHAKLASTNDQFEMVAVVDPSPESQSLVQSQLKLPVISDYRSLLGQIQAAIVATPTASHYEIGSHLLREGIHCFIEKPLASTTDQAARLVQIAKRHSLILQTGHVERFNPKWTAAMSHLGVPKFVDAVRCGTYTGRSTDIGVVMDLMIHDLDLILSLDRSEILRIDASGLALLGRNEDLAEARLSFASGLVANLKASRIAQSAVRQMQLYTTNCFAHIDFSADQFQLIQPSADVESRQVALDELEHHQRLEAKDRIFQTCFSVQTISAPGRNAIMDEQQDFALSIRTGSNPAVSGEDGALAVDVAERILDAIARRQWDGPRSRSWQTGALATLHPSILPIRADVGKDPETERRAG